MTTISTPHPKPEARNKISMANLETSVRLKLNEDGVTAFRERFMGEWDGVLSPGVALTHAHGDPHRMLLLRIILWVA